VEERQVTGRTARRWQPIIRRTRRRRLLGGVCSGFARYLGIHPHLVRAVFAFLAFAGGVGVVMYAVGWLIIPEDGAEDAILPRKAETVDAAWLVGGAFLIAVGSLLLCRAVFPPLEGSFWPSVVVAAGLGLLVFAARTED
jgi:phage shock protein PspC (stress-responsive transcriptional regulator)